MERFISERVKKKPVTISKDGWESRRMVKGLIREALQKVKGSLRESSEENDSHW